MKGSASRWGWPSVVLGTMAVALTVGVLAGCGRGSEAGGNGGAGGRRGAGAARAVAVEVAPVERGVIARTLTVSGVIEPIRTVAVNSQLAGALTAVNVEEGDTVRSGDVLARIDDRELQAQLEAAETEFQVAESAWDRSQKLFTDKIVTLAEYDRDRAAYVSAKAKRDQLQTRVAYAKVEAPISGVVTEKRVEAGDVVAPQSRLFTVVDLSTMVVPVQVSELDVVDLHVGDHVDLVMDAFPGRTFDGRIRRIFPSADPTTRLVPVEVALRGEALKLARPGFLARATFALGAHEGVLLLPASALVGGQRSQSVFVVEDGHALRRAVTVGLASQGRIEMVSGVKAGERVVTVGNNTLQDGALVRIVGAEAGGAGADAGARASGDAAGDANPDPAPAGGSSTTTESVR